MQADDKEKEENKDIYVNISNTTATNFWAKKLKTHPSSLKLAVHTVGLHVDDIKKWLAEKL